MQSSSKEACVTGSVTTRDGTVGMVYRCGRICMRKRGHHHREREGFTCVNMGNGVSWHDVRDMPPPELADLVRDRRKKEKNTRLRTTHMFQN